MSALYTIEAWSCPSSFNYGFSLPERRPAELKMVPLEIWYGFSSEMNYYRKTVQVLTHIFLVGYLVSVSLFLKDLLEYFVIVLVGSVLCHFYIICVLAPKSQRSVNRINNKVKDVQFSITTKTLFGQPVFAALIAKRRPEISTAWQTSVDPHTRRTKYYNTETRETSWDPPEAYINASWQSYVDPQTERMVYFNTVTSQTSSTPPSNCTVVPAPIAQVAPGTQPAEPIIQTVVSPIPTASATPINACDVIAAPAMLASRQPPPPAYSVDDQKRGDNNKSAFDLDI